MNNPTILLTGDFNLPGIDWSESLVKHSSSFREIHEYSLEILQDHGLQQLVMITFPTCDFNTLDLVSSNKPSTILNIQSIAGISDHDIVCFEVNAKVVPNKSHIHLHVQQGKLECTQRGTLHPSHIRPRWPF